MDGAETVVLDAPQETGRETPTQPAEPTTGESGKGTASPAAQPVAQTATPDIDTLLQNEEYRKTLRAKLLESDPDIKKEIDHRVRSTRQADIQAQVQAQVQAVLAQQQAERELQQREAALRAKLEADPYDLGTQHLEEVKGQLTELEKQRGQQQQNALLFQAQQAVAPRLFEQLSEAEYQRRVMTDPNLSDEEKRALNWRDPQWASRDDWLQAVDDARIAKRVEKALKAKMPVEVEARVQERLGEKREAGETIPAIPPGAGPASDSEFLARVANDGSDYDRTRMNKLLKQWDVL